MVTTMMVYVFAQDKNTDHLQYNMQMLMYDMANIVQVD